MIADEIYSLSLASSLPTLPFEVFRQLLIYTPLNNEDGVLLRQHCIEMGAVDLVLNCLGIFTHNEKPAGMLPGVPGASANVIRGKAAGAASSAVSAEIVGGDAPSSVGASDDKSHMYWAKGTGFGTGSTTKSFDMEQVLSRQRIEDEHVTIFLQLLTGYVNPAVSCGLSIASAERQAACSRGQPLPAVFYVLLQQSCLINALCSYLRNDSVLDITRHIPLYRAILQLLRALALSGQLVRLLLPHPDSTADGQQSTSSSSSLSIVALLANIKSCVDTYASRLK